MAGLELLFLGGFQAKNSGEQELRFETHKARALLAYLACEAAVPHSRDALAGLLWPEAAQEAALTNLRSTLAGLRRTLGDHAARPPYLLISRESIQLNSQSDFWLDLAEFSAGVVDAGICRPSIRQFPVSAPPAESALIHSLESAVSLYRDAFLVGFPDIHSASFEEWVLLTRAQLQDHMLQALRMLADYFEWQGDYPATRRFAQRQIDLEPWQEEAHQQLMRIYAGSDQRSKALAQFETCRQLLFQGLGVDPSPATTRLYEQIKAGEVPRMLPATSRQVVVLPPAVLTPFVTRQAELFRLNQALQKTLSGQGQVMFVTGEPGSGKTALMAEFVRRIVGSNPGLVAGMGKCNVYAGIGDPYLPFLEILAMLTGDLEPQIAAGSVSREQARRLYALAPTTVQTIIDRSPDLIGRFVSRQSLLASLRSAHTGRTDALERLLQNASGAGRQNLPQTDLFGQYCRVLMEIASRQPLLLVIDDLHWADEASLSLLFHLGRRLAGKRILILCAYRPAELATGASGDNRLLDSLIHEFQRQFGDIHIDLDEAGGQEFIRALLDTEPNDLSSEFRQALLVHTHGNPLFTIEFINGLKERGDLVRTESGRWIEGTRLDWESLPPRVEAVISEQVSRLPLAWEKALAVASIEGEEFTAEVVAQVLRDSEAEVLDYFSGPLRRQHAMIYAVGLQRIGTQRLSRFRFKHILFQKYLASRMDPVERARIHEAVGSALESLYAGQIADQVARLAWHFEEAGLFPKAISYLQQAAARSALLTANSEAVAYYQHALELLERQPDNPQRAVQELGLRMGLAVPLVASRGYSSPLVGETYDRARQLCLLSGSLPQLVPALLGLGAYYSMQARYPIAKDIYSQILTIAQAAADPNLRMIADWQMGYINVATGQYLAGREYLEKALAAYDPHKYDSSLYFQEPGVSILTWSARALWSLGYPDQAYQRSLEALDLADEREHPFSQAFAYGLAASLNKFRQDVDGTLAAAQRTIELSTRFGFPIWIAFGQALHGWALAQQDQVQPGLQEIQAGIELTRSIGARQPLIGCLFILAEIQALAGQVAQAAESVDESLAIELASGGEFNLPLLYILQGDLYLRLSTDAAQAEASYQRAIAIAQRQGAKSWELRALLALCRLWQHQGKHNLIRQRLTGLLNGFTEGFDTPDQQVARALLAH